MRIIKDIEELKEEIKAYKALNLSIGFVPTMGYLHEGHLSLVKAARSNDKVVLSIFVNPMQFGANEDLANYPRDLEKDCALCADNGVDIVFAPNANQLYPQGFCSFVDVKNLGDYLCGAKREGHFRGVCTILAKFFNLVKPDVAYFGLKDAQQCAIVSAMVRDLNFDLQIKLCETIREPNALAKSSRNSYLSKSELEAALVLSKALNLAKDLIKNGEKDCANIILKMKEFIEKEPLARVDYIEIVDFSYLKPIKSIENNALIALAVFIGKTRLIDNFLYKKD